MSTVTTSVHYCTGISRQCSQPRKINKSHPDWKGRSKTLYSQVAQLSVISFKKLLEQLSALSKVAGHSTNSVGGDILRKCQLGGSAIDIHELLLLLWHD